MSTRNQTIIQLDKKTINKIAAGEVVERPASVVKELIENSIDAQATEIFIFIKGYGLDEIKIVDNGIGMSKEDAALAWKSHTTSKLRSVEDLEEIISLGFRGEALASIASVSMLEILTRMKDQIIGTTIRVKGGDLEFIEEKECAPGTTITVRNLFYNVPARKKFLKSKTTELGHILEIVSRQALIRPNIHFKLLHEVSVLINSPKSNNPLEPFISIFGVESAKKMLPVAYETEDARITGYTSIPDLSRATRESEIFYVNKRFVKSKILTEAVEEAYKTLLMKNRYPMVFLNIELNASKVDVNIHPTKREIRFDDASKIHSIVVEAVTKALASEDLWRGSKSILKDKIELAQTKLPFGLVEQSSIGQEKLTEKLVKPSITNQTGILSIDSELGFRLSVEGLQSESRTILFSESFWLKPLGQALQLYALCESSEGIAIVDLHAAHERIKYEELMKRYDDSKLENQELLQPITFSFNPEQLIFIKDYLFQFQKLGLNFELFGGSTYIIRSLPVIMDFSLTELDIKNMIEEIRNEIPNLKTLNERIDLIIKKMACHSVVRGGDSVNLNKIITILKELSICKKPFTCPHGRPTIIKIAIKDLEKEFGRII
ncbi:MAG TPA: DNA mismatch repair endonuclease MutL [Candidatus Bathyarchaeia archaeon]|nr:DNA mismatch repair endonuclease MutL [Candidatus Bathyarchaeia archaeon]